MGHRAVRRDWAGLWEHRAVGDFGRGWFAVDGVREAQTLQILMAMASGRSLHGPGSATAGSQTGERDHLCSSPEPEDGVWMPRHPSARREIPILGRATQGQQEQRSALMNPASSVGVAIGSSGIYFTIRERMGPDLPDSHAWNNFVDKFGRQAPLPLNKKVHWSTTCQPTFPTRCPPELAPIFFILFHHQDSAIV